MKKQNLSKDKHTYFSSLSEQELKNLLMTDFQSIDGEILTAEDIDMILGIILEREKIAGIPTENDVEKSWKFFVENYLPLAEQGTTLYDYPKDALQPKRHEKKKIFRGKNIAAASLVFCIAFGAFSTTTNARELFAHMANWTKDTFWFSHSEEANVSLKAEFDTVFSPMEIPEYLLPTWIPDHFMKVSESGYDLKGQKQKSFFYESDSSSDFFSISVSYLRSNPTVIYEKDTEEVVIYQKDGVDYYIMSNLNTITAVWKVGSFECQISGNIEREDLIKMIDSIPSL
ncbi:MAG: DUF4367 domain-containing protein [Anaerotignum sp.]|nr:DUF4367 domain-containing protein [Anaerotignum sp.]